jgi:ribosomal protein S17E
MGKTKSKSIRKSAKVLNSSGVKFNESFEKNKKILTGLTLSKKLRNQMAGLFTRTKRQEMAKQEAEKAPKKRFP